MFNSELDFLRKIERAKTEDEKTWLTTKRLIDSLPEDIQALVFSAAIPHWFDAKILRTLHPELGRRINSLYSKIQKLPFVEPYEGHGYNIHELTRRTILDYLWRKQRRLFRSKSQILAKFYDDSSKLAHKKVANKIKELGNIKNKKKWNKEIQQWARTNPEIVNAAGSEFLIEHIYHMVIAQPKQGTDNFRDTGWKWHDEFDYSYVELNSLIDSVGEHITTGRIKGRALGWESFFRGLIFSYQYEFGNAKAHFLDVINKSYPDRKLNADVRFRLGNVHMRLSELPEARARYEEALPLYRSIKEKLGEANCIRSLGDVHMRLSELPEARARFEEALSLYRAISNKLGEANCIRSLGDVHMRLSELPEARARFEEALPLYRAISNKLGEANCIRSLGDVHMRLSELPEARARYEEALPLYRAISNKLGEANCIKSLGDVHMRLSELPEARARYEEALPLYRAIKEKLGEANCIKSLGDVHGDLSELPEARARYEEALPLYRAISNKLGEANCIRSLGDVHMRLSELPEARARYEEALPLYRSIKEKLGEANCIKSLGDVHGDLSELPEARARYEEALPLYRSIKEKLGEANCIKSLGDVHGDLSELPEARARYEEALPLYRAISNKLGEANCIRSLGDVHGDLSELPEARARYEEALPLYRAISNKLGEANCIRSLGDVHMRLSELPEARARYEEALSLYRAISNKLGEASAYSNLAILLRLSSRDEDAIPILEKLVELQPDNGVHRSSLMAVLRNTGKESEAKKQEEAARKLIENESEYNRACFESLCGNIEEALALLKIAFEKGQSSKEWARQDPDFENIHNDPRFKELVDG